MYNNNLWRKMGPYYNKLLYIQQTESYELLDDYIETSAWKEMTSMEREAFSNLLFLGSVMNLEGPGALKNLDLAIRICKDHERLFDTGIELLQETEKKNRLKRAYNAFYKAAKLQPAFSKAWYEAGKVLLTLGITESSPEKIALASEHFKKASENINELDVTEAEFYAIWGFCHSNLGILSGEPSDFMEARVLYKKAYDLNLTEPHFLVEFGNTVAELGHLFADADSFLEANELFALAVKANPDHASSRYNLACASSMLYDIFRDEEALQVAEANFDYAAKLEPDNAVIWSKWADFDLLKFRHQHDFELLKQCIHKAARSIALNDRQPVTLRIWAHAEISLGSHLEDLQLLHKALERINEAINQEPEDPFNWYVCGLALLELGDYFEDAKYYQQAVEKFQYGLSLSQNDPNLWNGLAQVHYALGELNDEPSYFEKAARSASKACECSKFLNPAFINDWGLALMKLGDLTYQPHLIEEAIDKFHKTLENVPQPFNPQGQEVDWASNLGCAYYLLADQVETPNLLEKAIMILHPLVENHPHLTVARTILANSLSLYGDASGDADSFQQAFHHYEKLLEECPDDEGIHLDYGVGMVSLSLLVNDRHHDLETDVMLNKAEKHMMTSFSLGLHKSIYQLAGLYSITERYPQAMQALERAHQLDALPHLEVILKDAWLEGLRHTQSFRQFIQALPAEDLEYPF